MIKINSNLKHFNAHHPVVAMGMFDGVHQGHLALLELLKQKARQMDGESVVLTFWPHPRIVLAQDSGELKLLTTLEEKTRFLAEAGIDHIVVLPFTKELAALTAEAFISQYLLDKIRMKHLIVGYNHRFGHDGIDKNQLQPLSEQYHFTYDIFGPTMVEGVKPSSTVIRKMITDGDVGEASILLGRHYSLKGRIVGGRKLGRKIGYPTANVEIDDPLKLVPHDGVYACRVHLLGRDYGGMINIGERPTIDGSSGQRSLEVHIFDFNSNVYSEEIIVEFIKRTRPEIKFPNLNSLKERLKKDEIEVRNILKETGTPG
ncbi:bifunctional riboflavin kinase/FAD synthetase [Thermophagus sp. OGC60D27]|uniref:bifunctional riboflavin kinase/FAD synthetase n=1 Tax=Thermophagus sp. OGC60D27 TaxID=3458415 RepID=UPI004037B252